MSVFELEAKISLDKSEYDRGLKQASKDTKSFGSRLAAGLKTVGKIAGIGLAAATTATAVFTKKSLTAYSAYEQLVGGVDTLFKRSSMSIEEYAEKTGRSVREATADYYRMNLGANTVMKNAEIAFQTAGMSANEYMETVTSFSASLIQSLGGDTVKAARYADVAIRDMSDNANKMGSDISSIQAAYSGFAKQNYTMLDNLKLGYGGTKTEMERLITDAEKLDSSFVASRKKNGELAMSYSDIVDAIHIVQKDMGIAGTTAKEASTTIEGSIKATKAAWQNLLTGLGDDDADVEALVDNLVDSAVTAAGNIIPRIGKILSGLGKVVTKSAKEVIPKMISGIIENLPALIQAGTELLVAVVLGLVQAIPQLITAVPKIISSIVSTLQANWPQIKEAGVQLLSSLIMGIINGLSFALSVVVDVMTRIWEAAKEATTKVWAKIKTSLSTAWNNIKTTVTEKANSIKESVTQAWNNLKTSISDTVGGIKTKVSQTWSQIKNSVTESAEGLRLAVSSAWDGLKTKVSGVVNNIKGTIQGIVDKFNEVKEAVSRIIDGIKGLFDGWEWKIPDIHLPRVFGGGSAKLQTHATAYETPYVFDKPTIFHGFGDGPGREMVYGHANLMDDIKHAVASAGSSNVIINVYPQKGQSEEEIARQVERIFVKRDRQRKAAKA